MNIPKETLFLFALVIIGTIGVRWDRLKRRRVRSAESAVYSARLMRQRWLRQNPHLSHSSPRGQALILSEIGALDRYVMEKGFADKEEEAWLRFLLSQVNSTRPHEQHAIDNSE